MKHGSFGNWEKRARLGVSEIQEHRPEMNLHPEVVSTIVIQMKGKRHITLSFLGISGALPILTVALKFFFCVTKWIVVGHCHWHFVK